MSKRKAWTYSLQVRNGTCGRDKKPRVYAFTIAETETEDKKDMNDLLPLIKKKLVDAKYKDGTLALVVYPMTLEDHSHHSSRATRTKHVQVSVGEVLMRWQGINLLEEKKAVSTKK